MPETVSTGSWPRGIGDRCQKCPRSAAGKVSEAESVHRRPFFRRIRNVHLSVRPPALFTSTLSLILLAKYLILLVPDERFELPPNGLQNRCSTTELIRQAAEVA